LILLSIAHLKRSSIGFGLKFLETLIA